MASKYSVFTILLCIVLSLALVSGHIPMSYSYKSAEPDDPIYSSDETFRLSRETSVERLAAMRVVMLRANIDAYIVPTGDAHNSQYISPADARREWLSGLRGSSGTVVVTATRALVWTDARYWTQFETEVNTDIWELMKQGTDLSIPDWLSQNLEGAAVVGVDPTTYTRNAWNTLEAALMPVAKMEAIEGNLVDAARIIMNDGPPERDNNPLVVLSTQFTGRASLEKVSDLVQQINGVGATALLLTALDDIAYTLNLRGTDIPYNPVFFSYLLIRADVPTNNVILFWGDGTLSSEVVTHLSSENLVVECRPYSEIFDYLTSFSNSIGANEGTIWLSNDASHAVYSAIEQGQARTISASVTPVANMKTVKNQVELQGFRAAHIKDGVALVRGLHWVEQQVAAGVQVTEVQLSDQLETFRGDEENFRGPSFATIAGAGANGAIIHYKALREGPQKVIEPTDMLLVDSGGQYLEGTTDITRTRHMSASPTPAQRLAFTRVLKGQIALATVVFPSGILGNVVEVLARSALWQVGLNYGHGTGHGVGHFLNVHEGPAWILSGPTVGDPGIRPNMVYSNEPGYYEVGEYGIRHEDLVETILLNNESEHPYAPGLVGDFEGRGAAGFYTISLAPHQTACLDVELLSDFEIKYLNDYHARVFSTLGPILQQRGFTAEYDWLQKECAPIGRSSAMFVKSTPILAAISVVVVWFRNLGM